VVGTVTLDSTLKASLQGSASCSGGGPEPRTSGGYPTFRTLDLAVGCFYKRAAGGEPVRVGGGWRTCC